MGVKVASSLSLTSSSQARAVAVKVMVSGSVQLPGFVTVTILSASIDTSRQELPEYDHVTSEGSIPLRKSSRSKVPKGAVWSGISPTTGTGSTVKVASPLSD